MTEDGEVFFVDSSDEEGDLDAVTALAHRRAVASGQEAVSNLNRARSPVDVRLNSSAGPSIEDVLFERRRTPSAALLTAASTLNSFSSTNQLHRIAEELESARAPVPLEVLSGKSVNMLPGREEPSQPRSLAHLRGMTSSEVRETLEAFFLRKEAAEAKFQAAARALREKTEADRAAGVMEDMVTIRRRDRCNRLVNVSNWGDGEDSPHDVLLPASLVPTSAYYTEQANKSAATSEGTRTLRQHQIDGIRFMWCILHEGPVGKVPAVGCILAHTMGLGKTAQVVLLSHLFAAANGSVAAGREHVPVQPRILIVVPKSTISVWQREFSTWGTAFPARARLTPLTLEGGAYGSPTGVPGDQAAKTPAMRLKRFRAWRRNGGVLLVGYEALVRLMQLVQEDHSFRGPTTGDSSNIDDTHVHRDGLRERRDDRRSGAASDPAQKHLAAVRRRDEGGLAYGGANDPFTELLVCDEAHRLKSVHLQLVTALRGLHPLRRLLLTGTPLQNHLSEYWAMIDFAVHKYFDRSRFKNFFVQSIESSINKTASRHEVALARKKTFTLINEVKHFVLRVDSSPLKAELPALHEYVVVVPLSDLQRSIYCKFVELIPNLYNEKGSGFQFLPAVSFAGKIASHPQLLFEMRDRMASVRRGKAFAKATGANSTTKPPTAAAESRSATTSKNLGALVETTRRRRQRHKRRRGSFSPSSARADDSYDSLFCEEAASAPSTSGSSTSSSNADDDDDVADEAAVQTSRASFSQLYESSTDYDGLCEPPPSYVPRLEDGVKLHVAMNIIKAAIRKGEKTLLFSLSTRLLDFFERLVAQVNMSRDPAVDPLPIRYCRLDGSHSGAQRASMLSDFNSENAGLNLFLLSMKAGGVGITITAATRVILADSSFNPADDQQAIGRAYRYGQTKPVYVYRLLCHQTLEYSIFEQKLAKDWLFKTVVEETSMKRDGLAGMHLRQIFSLLNRSAKAMRRAPTVTPGQRLATDALIREDDVLSAIRPQILYAQRYAVLLAQDADEQYGAEEQKYYDRYRRDRMFDVGTNVLPPEALVEELRNRKRQREQQAQHLAVNAQSLTGMVDRLIRLHASTDPHLAHLLSVMGLHVDPATGQVQNTAERVAVSGASAAPYNPVVGGSVASRPIRRRELVEVDDSGLTIPDSTRNDYDDGGENNHRKEEDDDAEELDLLLSSSSRTGPPATGVVVDPRKYETYRPGNSAYNAIDIDSE